MLAVAALRRIRRLESDEPSQSYHSMPSSLSSSSSILNNLWSTVNAQVHEQYDPTVLFEISVTNVDKPPIDPVEVERRLSLFSTLKQSDMPRDWAVILTNAPLFAQKASILDNLIDDIHCARKMTFVIGECSLLKLCVEIASYISLELILN